MVELWEPVQRLLLLEAEPRSPKFKSSLHHSGALSSCCHASLPGSQAAAPGMFVDCPPPLVLAMCQARTWPTGFSPVVYDHLQTSRFGSQQSPDGARQLEKLS